MIVICECVAGLKYDVMNFSGESASVSRSRRAAAVRNDTLQTIKMWLRAVRVGWNALADYAIGETNSSNRFLRLFDYLQADDVPSRRMHFIWWRLSYGGRARGDRGIG